MRSAERVEVVSAGPGAPHPREATLAHRPRDQRGKWEGAQEATRLAEGALDSVQGAEGKARAVLHLCLLRTEKLRRQPLMGAGLAVPCFPLKRVGGSGKKGEHVLNNPEQFTDWTEEAAEAQTGTQGSCFHSTPDPGQGPTPTELACGDYLRKGRPQEGGNRAEPPEEEPGGRRRRGAGGTWQARWPGQGRCWLQPSHLSVSTRSLLSGSFRFLKKQSEGEFSAGTSRSFSCRRPG